MSVASQQLRNLLSSRTRKFFSYYQPYQAWLFADLACAFVVSATTLALPVFASIITKTILPGLTANALSQIYAMGAVMLGLVCLHTAANMFLDYHGHLIGASMQSDIR